MKNTIIFAVLLTVLGYATAQAESFEHVTVTGKWTAQDVEFAKHKIASIQTDPGYYYSGAAGATHRIHDVKAQQAVIDGYSRMPASTK